MSQQIHISVRRLLGATLAVAVLAGIHYSESWRNRQSEVREEASQVPTGELAHAIEVAREYIEQHAGTPIDARYSAKETSDGYRVFVQYSKGYDSEGRPLPVVGGNCELEISKDWQVGDLSLRR